MIDTPTDEFFLRLQKDYEKTIPEKLAYIGQLIDELKRQSSQETIFALRFAVHKLAGSAGTYGYPEASKLCRLFEEELLKLDVSHSGKYLEEITRAFSCADNLLQKIGTHKAVIAAMGLGYTGLSLLNAFGEKGFSLIGYDIDTKKVQALQRGESCYNFVPLDSIFSSSFTFSDDPFVLEQADVIIICVSTPLDAHHLPELSSLKSAFHTVRAHVKKEKRQLIVLQSTTYPGTTEEELLPILAEGNLVVGKDFFLAYVPEISDPGNTERSFSDIPKIVSGITPSCKQLAEALYQAAGCKTVSCSSPRVAEAAKILQNTYRLVNISLVNELKMMFDKMGMDVWEVIAAASSKPFGFTPFYPSPGIGGECIAVVPTYLSWKAQETDGPTSLIDLAASVNRAIPAYVVDKIDAVLNTRHKSLSQAKILILGVGYKKDVNDLREASSLKIITLLRKKQAFVEYHDPYVLELKDIKEYPDLKMTSVQLTSQTLASYDAVVIITDHSLYDWAYIGQHSHLIVDTRNVMTDFADSAGKVFKA